MSNHENLKQILESKAGTAYERLKELLYHSVDVNPISFSNWPEQCANFNLKTNLVSKLTILYSDGWERYTLLGKSLPSEPLFQLYVAGHNAVYNYSLNPKLNDKLKSLVK